MGQGGITTLGHTKFIFFCLLPQDEGLYLYRDPNERTNERVPTSLKGFHQYSIEGMDGPWKVYFETLGKSEEECILFLSSISSETTKSIWYLHPNGKQGKGPHIHGLVYDYPKTAETLRNNIKKTFNLVKPSQFGISNKYERGTIMSDETVDYYITYMSKGIHEPLYNYNYDPEEIYLLKEKWASPASEASGMSEANAVSSKKPTLWNISTECAIAALDLYKDGKIMVNDLPDLVVNKLHSYSIIASDRTVINIVQDIMWRMDDGFKTLRRNRIMNAIV